MAKTLARNLDPQYVIIKKEFVDEDDGATILHYDLASGGAESVVMANFRFENPKQVFGTSYSIPCKSFGSNWKPYGKHWRQTPTRPVLKPIKNEQLSLDYSGDCGILGQGTQCARSSVCGLRVQRKDAPGPQGAHGRAI